MKDYKKIPRYRSKITDKKGAKHYLTKVRSKKNHNYVTCSEKNTYKLSGKRSLPPSDRGALYRPTNSLATGDSCLTSPHSSLQVTPPAKDKDELCKNVLEGSRGQELFSRTTTTAIVDRPDTADVTGGVDLRGQGGGEGYEIKPLKCSPQKFSTIILACHCSCSIAFSLHQKRSVTLKQC